jgi:hypothetical protein
LNVALAEVSLNCRWQFSPNVRGAVGHGFDCCSQAGAIPIVERANCLFDSGFNPLNLQQILSVLPEERGRVGCRDDTGQPTCFIHNQREIIPLNVVQHRQQILIRRVTAH